MLVTTSLVLPQTESVLVEGPDSSPGSLWKNARGKWKPPVDETVGLVHLYSK